jgi:hypothetical protein
MDSTLAATLISAPVALFAAVAAYGAGRVQGRGAVDSVRRTSQRDSYALFLDACYEFTAQCGRTYPPSGQVVEAEVAALIACSRRVGERASYVTLDGPPGVAQLAHDVFDAAEHLALDARLGQAAEPGRGLAYDVRLTKFVSQASAHLNTGLLRRGRR